MCYIWIKKYLNKENNYWSSLNTRKCFRGVLKNNQKRELAQELKELTKCYFTLNQYKLLQKSSTVQEMV